MNDPSAASRILGRTAPHCRFSLSVVINAFGAADRLRDCLGSLRRLDADGLDVVVVVGPGSPAARTSLDAQHTDVRVVECPIANISASRNLGWRAASGDLVAFMDDGAVALPSWLRFLREPFADERVGAAGGFVLDHTGTKFQSQFLTIDPLCNPVQLSAGEYDGPLTTDKPISAAGPRFKYLAGTNMMYRRAALRRSGGFDEAMTCGEDAEMCLRLYADGWRVAHVPHAQVVHRSAPDQEMGLGSAPRMLFDTVSSFTYFKFCHGRRFHPTGTVLASIKNSVQQTQCRVDQMFAAGQIDKAHLDRLRSEIDAGVRHGTRRALLRSPVRATLTSVLAVSQGLRPFSIIRPAGGRRLRLCLVSRELPPRPAGGIGVWVWCLARRIADLGHDVTVIAEAETGSPPTMEFIDGCWVHRNPTLQQFGRRNPDLSGHIWWTRDNNYRVFDTVARAEAADHFDVVLAPLWEAQGLACLRGRQGLTAVSLHTPLRTVIRTSRNWHPDEAFLEHFAKPMFAAEVELLTHSPIVLANGNAIVEEIEQEYGIVIPRDALRIVPHGVDDLGFVPEFHAMRPFKKLLFVGRFEGRKGVDIVLDAIPQLLSAHPPLVVELCGDTDVRFEDGQTYLSKFLARNQGAAWLDRVLIRGMVSDSELLEAYRSCDIFVAPSRFESFGLIYIEAMRFAKPVVALDVGGAREVLEHGVTGMLVSNDSPSCLAAAIDRLLKDDALRATMGQRAREAFMSRFTARQMADRIVDVLMDAVHARAARDP